MRRVALCSATTLRPVPALATSVCQRLALSTEAESKERSRKLRELVLGRSRAQRAEAAKSNATPSHTNTFTTGAAGRVIQASDVIFSSADPLKEVIAQIEHFRREWTAAQRQLKGLILKTATQLVIMNGGKATEEAEKREGLKKIGTSNRKGRAAGPNKQAPSPSHPTQLLFDFEARNTARIPMIASLREAQLQLERQLAHQLVPMAAKFCKIVVEQHQGIGSAGGDRSQHPQPEKKRKSVWGKRSNNRVNEGIAQSRSDFEVHDDGEVLRQESSTTASSEAAHADPPKLELPTFEQLSLLLRAAAESGDRADYIIVPLMQCLKLRMERRQAELDQRKGERPSAAPAPSSVPPPPAADFELSEEGLWNLVGGGNDGSATTTTPPKTTIGDSTPHSAKEPAKAFVKKDSLRMHPRVAAELLSSCAQLGAMEELLLIALLETDIRPQIKIMGAGTLVVIMEALGRFGYHKAKENIFVRLAQALGTGLRPMQIPEARRSHDGANKAERAALKRRHELVSSVPQRQLLGLFRFLGESPVRSPNVMHRLADVLIYRTAQQMRGTFMKCRAIERREVGRAASVLSQRHSIHYQLCADAVSAVLEANGFPVPARVADNRRIEAILDAEEGGDGDGEEELSPTPEPGSRPQVLPAVSAHELRQICQLLTLMDMPYEPLEKLFLRVAVQREHGIIVGREPRQRRAKPENAIAGGGMDYIKLQSILGNKALL